MKKQLLLIRHAKSDWGSLALKDFDRPLNARGFFNAPEMGKRWLQKNIFIDAFVSSPAMRAITTAKLIAIEIAFDTEKIIKNPSVYHATQQQLLSLVNKFDNNFNSIALVGHNPGLSEFANYLTNSDNYNLPTCAMVLITFDTDNWDEVSGGTGEVSWFDYPKNTPELG